MRRVSRPDQGDAMVTEWLKKHRTALFIGAAFALGAFLHLRNLWGTTQLMEDEVRAFKLGSDAQLIYFMCHPVYLAFGHNQSAVYLLAGLVGCAGIFLFYRLVRLLFDFDPRIAAYATLVYAFFPLRINFSRMLYPPVFVDLYFLSAFLCIAAGFLRRRTALLVAGGALTAALLYVYHGAYHVIIGLVALGLGFVIREWRGSGWRPAITRAGLLVLGAAGSAFIIDTCVTRIAGAEFSAVRQLAINTGVELRLGSLIMDLPSFLRGMYQGIMRIKTWIPISLVTAAACIATVWSACRLPASAQKTRLIIFLTPYLAGAGIFILLAAFKWHMIQFRHLVWLTGMFAVSAAYLFLLLFDRARRAGRILVCVFFALFAALLFVESYLITTEEFRLGEIRGWLEQHGIPRGEVASSWWWMNRLGDAQHTSNVPGFFKSAGKLDVRYWFHDEPEFVIGWPMLIAAYRQGMIRYLVTSGIGARFGLGKEDLALKEIKPVKSWLHPYTRFKRRPYYLEGEVYINLYDLDDVFVLGNVPNLEAAIRKSEEPYFGPH